MMMWLAIVGCWCGFYPKVIMAVLYILAFARYGYAVHDAMHAGQCAGFGVQSKYV